MLTCLSAFLLRPGRKPLLSFARPLGSTLRKSAGRRERSCQRVNQRSPNIPKGGGGLEHALKTVGKRRRAPRLAAGLILVQARATSPCASPGRRALLRRRQRTSGTEKSSKGGAAPPGSLPGLGTVAVVCCHSRVLPVERKPGPGGLGIAAGSAPGPARSPGSAPGDGTSPPGLALRDTVGLPRVAAGPWRAGEVLPKGPLCRNESRA